MGLPDHLPQGPGSLSLPHSSFPLSSFPIAHPPLTPCTFFRDASSDLLLTFAVTPSFSLSPHQPPGSCFSFLPSPSSLLSILALHPSHPRISFHIRCLWPTPFHCSSPRKHQRGGEILLFLHPHISEARGEFPLTIPPPTITLYFCPQLWSMTTISKRI